MKRSIRTFTTAVLLATPLLLVSCSEAADPIAPSPAVERQDGLIGDLLGGLLGLLGSILSGPDANGATVEKWIGSGGGTLSTAAYTLTVPAYAVSEKTLFRIEPTNNGLYSVELGAYKKGLLGLGLVNVGYRGFGRPVKLTISYANANGVTDPSDLVIAYIGSNGSIEIQSTVIDQGDEDITASLKHFSKYVMAQN